MVALNTLITFVVVAIIAILIFRVLGWALAPFIGNIIAGGLLYWLIDAMLMKLPVALFGIPGTIVIAICRALF